MQTQLNVSQVKQITEYIYLKNSEQIEKIESIQ
jgi:hypothetical protein